MLNYKKIQVLIYLHTKGNDDKKIRLTREEIATKINISKLTLDNIASGKSNPKTDTIEKIAIYFNKDMNYFFDTFEHLSKSVEKKSENDTAIEPNPDWLWKRYDEMVIKLKAAEEKLAAYEKL